MAAGSGSRPHWMDWKFFTLVGIGLAAVVVIAMNLFGGSGGPKLTGEEATRDQMSRLSSAVQTYVAVQQAMPAGLSDVPDIKSTRDGWGREITFAAGTEGSKKTSFTLRSSGADGQAETADDWVAVVKFGDDGYGKLGVESSELRAPEAPK